MLLAASPFHCLIALINRRSLPHYYLNLYSPLSQVLARWYLTSSGHVKLRISPLMYRTKTQPSPDSTMTALRWCFVQGVISEYGFQCSLIRPEYGDLVNHSHWGLRRDSIRPLESSVHAHKVQLIFMQPPQTASNV